MVSYRNVIILAKSYRLGERCIAGIFEDTGEWVRPIAANNDGCIDRRLVEDISLLDVVKIPFSRKPDPPIKYQSENWIMAPGKWEFVRKIIRQELLRYCENDGLLMYSTNDCVKPSYLDSLPPAQWKSLQLLRVRANFVKDRSYYTRPKYRVMFEDKYKNMLNISVTNEEFLDRLESGEKFKDKEFLITVSLGRPWQPPNGGLPLKCYKLAAGILELE